MANGDIRRYRRVTDRWWMGFGLLLVAAWAVYVLAWVATLEAVERCAHGFVGPGGSFRVERGSFPPDVRCEFTDGTVVSTAAGLGPLLWMMVSAALACGLLALMREAAGRRHPGAEKRLTVLSGAAATVLASLCGIAWLIAESPGSDELSRCPDRRGLQPVAQHRRGFPPQATCEYVDGGTQALVPAWVTGLIWAVLVLVVATAAAAIVIRRAGRRAAAGEPAPPGLGLVTLVVREYDEAIDFYTARLGFTLTQDTPLADGKRWVVVAPPGSTRSGGRGTALLLARAVTEEQRSRIGDQTGGRVGWFLHTDDFARAHARLTAAGVVFEEEPRSESYGRVAVFRDLYGNRWDLFQPAGNPAGGTGRR